MPNDAAFKSIHMFMGSGAKLGSGRDGNNLTQNTTYLYRIQTHKRTTLSFYPGKKGCSAYVIHRTQTSPL